MGSAFSKPTCDIFTSERRPGRTYQKKMSLCDDGEYFLIFVSRATIDIFLDFFTPPVLPPRRLSVDLFLASFPNKHKRQQQQQQQQPKQQQRQQQQQQQEKPYKQE